MNQQPLGLLLALGLGLLIGLERERRKGSGLDRGAAGIRSFALAALMGALTQSLGPLELVAVGAALVGTLAAISYAKSRSDDPGMTTELALLCTYLVGALALVDPPLAAGCGAGLAFLLEVRPRLHRFATNWLTDQELRDALLLSVLVLVILPLVPDRSMQVLGGINPRAMAKVVVLIIGIQVLSHMAVRWLGPQTGLALTGAMAGWASSTAAIASLGAQFRQSPNRQAAFAVSAAWSTSATWALSLILAATVSLPAATALAPAMLAGLFATVLVCSALSWFTRGTSTASTAPMAQQQVVSLPGAMKLAVMLTCLTWLASQLQQWLGTRGLMFGIAIAGLADAHASLLSLTSLFASGRVDPTLLEFGLLLAISANSITRLIVALATGGWHFAKFVAAALATGLAGSWLSWSLRHAL